MNDLIDEIKAELHEERLAKIWKRYGNLIIGAAVAIVALTGIGVWYKNHQASVVANQGNHFYEVTNALGTKAGDNTLNALENMYKKDKDSFAALAGLKRAALLANNGKTADAITAYRTLAADKHIPTELRQLAALNYISYRANGDVAAINEEEISDMLKELTATDSPWRYSAKELEALIALRLGDTQKASTLYTELADDLSAPVSIRRRAREFADGITGEKKQG